MDLGEALRTWQIEATSQQPRLAALWSTSQREQTGYDYTLTEILQQPLTWLGTAETVASMREELAALLRATDAVALTGSGSSEYVGACVAPALRDELRRPVEALGGGRILTEGTAALPSPSSLTVSLARSGDSPESAGAVDLMLESAPNTRHLVITCNRNGRLATGYAGHPRVDVVTLDPRTNDRSLVMTSSFTNMTLAARFLGMVESPDRYRAVVRSLHDAGRQILASAFDILDAVANGPFQRAVYLGTGCRFGAARESALKMLEMTAGRVVTMAETYLGLRHGPLSFLDNRTLVLGSLSTDAVNRAYELDLLDEINRKDLGWQKVIVGDKVPRETLREGDIAIEYSGVADTDAPVLDVIVGQVLAFHKCIALGFAPDSPSAEGVISRVVSGFTLYTRPTEKVL